MSRDTRPLTNDEAQKIYNERKKLSYLDGDNEVLEEYADGSQLVVLNIEEEEKECLWCGTTKNLNFWVNDAWSVEKLCQECYDKIELDYDAWDESFEDWKKLNGVEPIGE